MEKITTTINITKTNNMKQQTAVEWLVMTYHQRQGYIRFEDIDRAKEMEKEQIKELIELPSDEEMRKELFYQKQVMNPYPIIEYAYTAYEKGFMDCAKLIIDRTLNK